MFQRVKGGWLWVILVACALIVASVRLTAEGVPRAIPSGLLQEVLAPAQVAATRVVSALQSAGESFRGMTSLRRENAELRRQAQREDLLEAQIEELKQENLRLQELLGFQRKSTWLGDARPLAARVIARNPDNWFSSVVIDAGAADGVSKGMVVFTDRGLVGRVNRVGAHAATVLLLTDPQSGMGTLVQRETSRAAGVVLGQAGRGDALRMKFFRRDADVRRGDRIVTSDVGRSLPAGIPVGTVTAVTDGDGGLVRYAWIKPQVDFDHLQEVLLIAPATLVPPAPADALDAIGAGSQGR